MQHATLYNIHAPCGASRSWASEQAKKGHGKHIRYSCPSWKKVCTWWRIKDVSVFKMNSEKICHYFPACSMLG